MSNIPNGERFALDICDLVFSLQGVSDKVLFEQVGCIWCPLYCSCIWSGTMVTPHSINLHPHPDTLHLHSRQRALFVSASKTDHVAPLWRNTTTLLNVDDSVCVCVCMHMQMWQARICVCVCAFVFVRERVLVCDETLH